jgi:hypothetical protein
MLAPPVHAMIVILHISCKGTHFFPEIAPVYAFLAGRLCNTATTIATISPFCRKTHSLSQQLEEEVTLFLVFIRFLL